MGRPWEGRPTPGMFLKVRAADLARMAVGDALMQEQSRNGVLLGVVRMAWLDDRLVSVRHDSEAVAVALTGTAQPLGGERLWFRCPRCACRVGILYGPGFACRRCKRISYPSQRVSPRFRPVGRAFAIRQRLGGELNMLAPFPSRPKGMHWSTYLRLADQYEHHTRRAMAGADAALVKLAARMSRQADGKRRRRPA